MQAGPGPARGQRPFEVDRRRHGGAASACHHPARCVLGQECPGTRLTRFGTGARPLDGHQRLHPFLARMRTHRAPARVRCGRSRPLHAPARVQLQRSTSRDHYTSPLHTSTASLHMSRCGRACRCGRSPAPGSTPPSPPNCAPASDQHSGWPLSTPPLGVDTGKLPAEGDPVGGSEDPPAMCVH